MIIIKIGGGLGNQMFNYAFGRSLSYDLNTEFLLDDMSDLNHENLKDQSLNLFSKIGLPVYNFLSSNSKYFNENCIIDPKYLSYKNMPKHVTFSLDCFNIKKNSINHKLLQDNIEEAKKNIINMGGPKFYRHYNPVNEDILLPAYFEGFFCFEEFFVNNEDIIREDFDFKLPINGKNKEITEDIQNDKYNSIAIHFRIGDYVSSPDHNVCSLDYYEKAIKFMLKKVDNPKFFIFSDNPEWVKDNIKIPEPNYFITNNVGDKSYEDMRLMSLCDHFIIANSTFSWWGAWLCDNKNKIVLQPKPFLISRINDTPSIENTYIPIKNDFSKYFMASNKTLFKLNSHNFDDIIKNGKNVNLEVCNDFLKINTINNNSKFFDENFLRDKSIKDISKIFLDDIYKINENDLVLLKLRFWGKEEDMFRIFYLSKEDKIYTSSKTFPIYFDKNEELNSFIPIPSNISLKGLILCPSVNNNEIILKELEFRELNSLN